MLIVQEILSTLNPIVSFMEDLWSVFPTHFRFLFAAFFAFFIGFTIVRNFMS